MTDDARSIKDLEVRSGREPMLRSGVALRVFIAALVLGAALGICAVLELVSDIRFLGTSAIVACACLGTFIAAIVSDHGRFRRSMMAATLSGLLAGMFWIGYIWLEQGLSSSADHWFIRVAGFLTLLAVWGVFSGATMAPRSGGSSARSLRWSVFLLGCMWSLFAAFAIFFERQSESFIAVVGEDAFMRTFGASVIMLAAGSIAQPVLLKLSRQGDDATALRGRRAQVAVACPRCQQSVVLTANTQSACPGCQLLMCVQFEEPRCECGYLYYGLESSQCPECGKVVPPHKRWSSDPTHPDAAITASQAVAPMHSP